MRYVRTVSRLLGAAVIVMALMGATEAPAQSPDCAVSGNFIFTVAAGSGFLNLLADGRAQMDIGAHEVCETCGNPGRQLTGTYRTASFPFGCFVLLDLVDPREPRNIQIVGATAFQGSVLVFQNATVGALGFGLALRTDTLTGRGGVPDALRQSPPPDRVPPDDYR